MFLLGMALTVVETIATLAMLSLVYRFGLPMAQEDLEVSLPPFKPRHSATTAAARVFVVNERRCVFRLRLGTWSSMAAYFPFKGTLIRHDGQAKAFARAPVGLPLALAGYLGAWSTAGLRMLTTGFELVRVLAVLVGWLLVAGSAIHGWSTERRRFTTALREVCDHLGGLAT